MATADNKKSLLQKIIAIVLGFGPGIFAIGYTIGTGSVTSMIVAGSKFNMQLLWVLLLSCVFSGILMFAYGNYALLTGETALYGFKKHLKYGKVLAILIIVGITFGQWNSLMGILGISSNIIYEILAVNFDGLSSHKYETVLITAIIIIVTFLDIKCRNRISWKNLFLRFRWHLKVVFHLHNRFLEIVNYRNRHKLLRGKKI